MMKSKLDSLPKLEKSLVFEFIEYTKWHDYEYVSERLFYDSGRELGVPAALRANMLDKLCRLEIFSKNLENNGLEKVIRIHPSFHDEAVPYYLDLNLPSEDNVPASDRFVSLKDNQDIVAEASASLTALSELVRGSNELFADADERIQISTEIDYVRELINKPKIHVSAVWDNVKNNNTLKWLVEQSVSGVVRQAAVKAMENLDKILHFLSSIF